MNPPYSPYPKVTICNPGSLIFFLIAGKLMRDLGNEVIYLKLFLDMAPSSFEDDTIQYNTIQYNTLFIYPR